MKPELYTLTNGHLRFNDGVKSVPDNFTCNDAITCDLNEVESVGDRFLYYNKVLTSFTAHKLQSIGYGFLFYNEVLTSFTAPVLQSVGNYFLYYNYVLTSFTAPELQSFGYDFLFNNEVLTSFTAPKLQSVGYDFLYFNKVLTSFTCKSHKFNIVKKDNITFVVKSTRKNNDTIIYAGFILNSISNNQLNKRDGYLVIQGELSAHGDTLKDALNDLQDKIKGDILSKEPINEDTVIDIERYHFATGSCRTGIKNWMQVNGIPEGLTAKELLPILIKHNAYGLEIFKKLITF